MAQNHHDPAEIATDELVSLLVDLRDANEFDATLAALRTALGQDDSYGMTIAKRYVPVSILDDSDPALTRGVVVSLLPGCEGHRHVVNRSNLAETWQVQCAVETHVGGNHAAMPLLHTLSRQVSDWIFCADGNADRRVRRQLTGIDGRITDEELVALFCPSTLIGCSCFLSLRKFHWEGET